MNIKVPVTLAILGFLLPGVALLAHHSLSAEFIADDARLVTVKGVLSKVDWVNPHIYFYVDVKDASGKTEVWSFENFPPSWWRRYGLSRDLLKIGEQITVEAYPARDGTKTLAWAKIIHFADGRTVATMTGDPKDVR
jgi:hypothetical protein